MFYVLQNESTAELRRIPILLTDAATGTTAQAGVSTASIYPYVAINGGAFIGGTGPVFESGFGQYVYQMHPAETATLGLAGIHITAPGCRNYDAIAQIAAFNVYSPSAGGGATAGDVWNYDISAISSAGLAGKQLNDAAAGGGVTALAVAQAVWDYDPALFNVVTAGEYLSETRTYAFNAEGNTNDIGNTVWNRDPISVGDPTTGDKYSAYLYQLGIGATGFTPAGGNGISAFDVWNYTLLSSATTADTTLGNIDSNVTTIQGNTSNIAGTVWNADLSSYSVLGNSAGSYLYFNTDKIFDNLNIPSSSIASSTWSYATRTLTSGGGITAGDVSNAVWNSPVASYSTNGTFGLNILRADQANKVGNVTLYSTGGVNGVDADVHRIANDTAAATAWKNILTGIGSSITSNITGNVSGSIGSVTSPVSVATASMTGIAGTVWNVATRTITGGTITTVSDKTGYSLSGTQSFNLTGNITGNLSGSVGSVSGAVGSVTGSVGSVTGSVGSVVSAVTLSGGTQSAIANTVWLTNVSTYGPGSAGNTLLNAGGGGVAITAGDIWTYFDRTLTSSSGATAGDVWSYNTRTLTSGAGITVIGAVQLVNGPYRLTSNQNNSDGILDILQNSVQEINLNLIDGNGSPASTAGYASIINIFDVAGVAVTSYTPTVEYADGGILNFELDTDVTSTIGRYNLIVGLSGAGQNVKYGPLQILVRPL